MARPRILVVDDDEAFTLLAREFLTDAGYAVARRLRGVEALATARARPPALVLLDVRMPGLGGLAVLEGLRRHARTAAVPVLLCSACAPAERAVWLDALAAAGAPILFKPFALGELLARVVGLAGPPAPAPR